MGDRSEAFVMVPAERGGEVMATKRNLHVVRHMGSHAIFDHCYVAEEGRDWTFVWGDTDAPLFNRLVSFAEQQHADISFRNSGPSESCAESYFASHRRTYVVAS